MDVLEEDDLFILVSDHGISDQGAHGSGNDENELESVFWLYSKQGFLGTQLMQKDIDDDKEVKKNLLSYKLF